MKIKTVFKSSLLTLVIGICFISSVTLFAKEIYSFWAYFNLIVAVISVDILSTKFYLNSEDHAQ